MSQAFDINTPITQLTITTGSNDTVAVTITNRLPSKVDMHVEVETSDPEGSGWLELTGEAVRAVGAGETATVVLHMHPPAASVDKGADKRFGVKVRVSDIANPTHHFAVSPVVDLTIRPSEPAGDGGKPWAWLTLAAGVVLIATVGYFLYTRRTPIAGLHGSCSSACNGPECDECETGLICADGGARLQCLRPPAAACSESS